MDGPAKASVSRMDYRNVQSIPVPMCLGILIQGRENDGEDDGNIVSHQVEDIFIVPVVEGSLRNLEVLTVNATSQLLE